jgi:hypothetical protein
MFLTKRRQKRIKQDKLILISFIFLGIFLVFWPTSKDAQWDESPYSLSSPIVVVADEPEFLFGFPANPDKSLVLATSSVELIDTDVAFTPQAPLGEWHDPRQQDGCEEASVLMAMSWAQGFELDPVSAKQKILEMSAFEMREWGSYVDTSAFDTMERLIKKYFNYPWVKIIYNLTPEDIERELMLGNLLIFPMNGRALFNPYFTAPGPERHMVLVRGYDMENQELITNDPGTRRGEAYRYKIDIFIKAIQDYPSGDHEPITKEGKAMIVVTKP